MRALLRSLRAEHRHIVVPWPSLAGLIKPGPGQLILVIADPGVGKSVLGLVWAMASGEPTLLLSWDTDLFTQGVRTAAYLGETTTKKVEENPKSWATWLEDMGGAKVRFVNRFMVWEDLQELVRAEKDFWPVRLIVVDSLAYMLREQASQTYDEAIIRLHELAQDVDATVLVLHHLNKKVGAPSGTEPPNLARARYGTDLYPEFVLGLWTPTEMELGVAVLKNRTGYGRPDASVRVILDRNLAEARIDEPSTVETYKREVNLEA